MRPCSTMIALAILALPVVAWSQGSSAADESTFKGHDSVVCAMALSPDGTRLVSGSGKGELNVWDTATRKRLSSVDAHEGPIYAVAITPNGKGFASAGGDDAVKIWSMASYANLYSFTLPRPDDPMESHILPPVRLHPSIRGALALSFSSTGRYLISGHGDFPYPTVIWDLKTGSSKRMSRSSMAQPPSLPPAPWTDVQAVALSPDGRLAASGEVGFTRSPSPIPDVSELTQENRNVGAYLSLGFTRSQTRVDARAYIGLSGGPRRHHVPWLP